MASRARRPTFRRNRVFIHPPRRRRRPWYCSAPPRSRPAAATTTAGDGGSSGGSSDQEITAACKLDNPPTSAAEAPTDSGSGGSASGKVGVILPDTTSSTRYTLYDAPLLEKALSEAGLTPDVQNAQGDKNKFASIAQNMIGDGVKVLIIDSIDAASGAGVEKAADEAGVKVIDYDRVEPRRHRPLLRVLRQRGSRQAPGPDAHRLPRRAGRRRTRTSS